METTAPVSIADLVRTTVNRELSPVEPDNWLRIKEAVDRAIASVLGPGTGELRERRYRDYVIQSAFGAKLPLLADTLTRMRAWDVASAPEPVGLIPMPEGYFFVSRYWACPGEQLLPVAGTNIRLAPEACLRFRHDMRLLAERDMLHPYAGRGYNAWLVGERSGTIVLTHWATFRPLLEREKEELLERLDELLLQRQEVI